MIESQNVQLANPTQLRAVCRITKGAAAALVATMPAASRRGSLSGTFAECVRGGSCRLSGLCGRRLSRFQVGMNARRQAL